MSTKPTTQISHGFSQPLAYNDYSTETNVPPGNPDSGKQITHPFNHGFYGSFVTEITVRTDSDSINVADSEVVTQSKSDADSTTITDEHALYAYPSDTDSVAFNEGESLTYSAPVEDDIGISYTHLLTSENTGSDSIPLSVDFVLYVNPSDVDTVTFGEGESLSTFSPMEQPLGLSEGQSVSVYSTESFTASEAEKITEIKKDSDTIFVSEDEGAIEFATVMLNRGFTTDIKHESHLVGLWRMNEFGATMRDESGFGNHASSVDITSGRPIISGDASSAFFNGTTSSITAPYSNNFRFRKKSFVVEFWMNDGAGTVVEQSGGWSIWATNGELHASLTDKSGNSVSGIIADSLYPIGGESTVYTDTDPRKYGYHVVVVFDRSIDAVYCYVDGVGMGPQIDASGIGSVDAGTDIVIGNGAQGPLNGFLGEVAIMVSSVTESSADRRFRSRSKVRDIDATIEYDMPYALFSVDEFSGDVIDKEVSEYTFDNFVVGNVPRLSKHQEGSAMDITGGGINVSPFDVRAIEFFVYTDAASAGLIYQHTDANGTITIRTDANSLIVEYQLEAGGLIQTVSFPLTENIVHFAMALYDDHMRFFIDGAESAEQPPRDYTSIQSIRLFSLDATAGFTGLVDYIALYDDLLSSRQVEAHYAVAFSGREHAEISDTSVMSISAESYSAYNYDWQMSSA